MRKNLEPGAGMRAAVRAACVGMLAVGALGASTASAELLFGAQVGVGHSDNITRVREGEVDETIGTAAVDLAWREQRRRLDLDVVADLAFFEYLDDTYDSEVLGTADATMVFGIVPERITWFVQDSFGQAYIDPFEAVTPDTRENLNYFTTGPDLALRFGATAALRLFGRYSTVQYEDSPLDSERVVAGLALARELSTRAELALNATTESIEFDTLPGADYDRHSAFLSYRIDGARGSLRAEGGYTWLDRSTLESSGGALLRLDLTRELSAASVLALSAGTQITDTSDLMRVSAAGEPVGGSVALTATSDPFENRFGSVEWRFSKRRTQFTLGAAWNDDRYEQEREFDRTRWVYAASFSRELSRTLSLLLRVDLADEDFGTTGFDAEELRAAAVLSWQFGRDFALNLLGERVDRSTSTGEGQFIENRAFVTLGYRPAARTQ